MAARKRQLFAGIRGNVLEIGPGTGVNIPYLPRDVHYMAVEPNPFMHRHLRKTASEHGRPVELLPEPFEDLDLPRASVDAVICTLVLCSVADPGAVVRRIQQVLRPRGAFVFIEHVAAQQGSWLRAIQRGLCPIWKVLGDGCHPDRETWRTLEESNFSSLTFERFRAPLPIVSPHIAGVAQTGEPAHSTRSGT